MIKSFKHKGLEKFFRTGVTSGINHQHKKRLRLILGILDAATVITDINSPGLRLHKLTGKRNNDYAVNVSGNWRVTFQFKDSDVYVTNYEDYH